MGGGGGNIAHVSACRVGVCARGERGAVYDEAFPQQRCLRVRSRSDGDGG